MNEDEKKLLSEWVIHKEAFLASEVEYWKDEARLYPFPAVVSSYSNALLRYDVFSDFRNAISVLLDTQL